MRDQAKIFHGNDCTQSLKRWLEHRNEDPSPPNSITWICSSCGSDRHGLWFEKIIGNETVRFRWTPPGSFTMGLSDEKKQARSPDSPSHTVILSRGFWIEDTPCTQSAWTSVMGRNPSHFRTPDRPVECVSWISVQRFIDEVRVSDPKFPCRLPTEAEWEYVCQHLDGEIEESAWVYENSDINFDLAGTEYTVPGPSKSKRRYGSRGTHPVRQKRPNKLGTYDLLGNVMEWCDDAPRTYGRDVVHDPRGTGSDERVLRGGDWQTSLAETLPTRRFSLDKNYCAGNTGFRLVATSQTSKA